MTGLPPIPLYHSQAPKTDSVPTMLGWLGSLLFLVLAMLLLLLGQTPAWNGLVANIAINFLAIMVEAMPFMLVGSCVGGLIEVFVPVAWVERVIRRHRFRAVFLAGAMGLLLPVCECAIVPVIRRLLGKGVPLAAALTLLIAGPIVNSIVAVSTIIAYGYDWLVAAVRLGCGYGIAVTVGLLLGRWFNRENGLLPEWSGAVTTSCGHQGCSHTMESSWLTKGRHALEHACDDFLSVGGYLVIGAFLAALIRSVVPMAAFTHLLETPWQAIVIMMAMAVLLNLCSEADAFIAASFRGILPASAQMAFMVLGPMLDIKLLLMYVSVFRKRLIVALAITIPVMVLLTMLGLQTLFPNLLE